MRSLSIATLAVLFIGCNPHASFQLTVDAGDYSRRSVLSSFTIPEELGNTDISLIDESGGETPVQIDANNRGWFIVDRLAAGKTKTYQVITGGESSSNRHLVSMDQQEASVAFTLGGQSVVKYHYRTSGLPRSDIDPIYERAGYLHPVYTPSGHVVTDDYASNHLHHHGIWAAWTNTVFQGRTPDFWNMGAGTGTVEVVALDSTWQGPIYGGLNARHRYVDLTQDVPVSALKEGWELRVYSTSDEESRFHLFDLIVTQATATDSALVLPEYHYGGVGFRGHWDWNGEENTFFLTSEGKDRNNGHATRARWCHIGGEVDGALVGIAILGHPSNFEAPQPMRIHPSEPFFNFAPSQAGEWSIEPGKPYTAQYRFVVYDGPPNAELLDRLWNDYAHPPVANLTVSN